MQKRIWLYLIFVISVSEVQAQDYLNDRPLPAGLADIIKLQELTEHGDKLDLVLGTIPQDVDVNSIIKIDISEEQLLRNTKFVSNSPLNATHQLLLDAANELEVSAGRLIKGLNLATELSKIDRDTNDFNIKARELQIHYSRSSEIIRRYINLILTPEIAALDQRQSSPVIRADNAVVQGRLAGFVANEIEWIIDQLENAGQTIIRSTKQVALNLVACFVPCDPNSQIHLEYYDSLEVGVPKPIDKLNVLPSPEQVEKLKVAYVKTQEIAEKINKIENGRKQLKEALNTVFKQHGIDLTELRNATITFKNEIDKLTATDWRKQIKSMTDRVELALKQSQGLAQKTKLKDIKNSLNSMQIKYISLENDVSEIKSFVNSINPRLDKAAVLGVSDPVDGVLALLGQVSEAKNVFNEIKKQLELFETNAKDFAVTFKDLSIEIKGIVSDIKNLDSVTVVKKELEFIVNEFTQETIEPVRKALKELRTKIGDISTTIHNLDFNYKRSLNDYASTEIDPPDTSFFVPLTNAKNTWLDLRTIDNRKDGGVVMLKASLFYVEEKNGNYVPTKLLDKDVQTFRTLRFGFYGDYSVGLAYVRSKAILAGQVEENKSFAPQVTWSLKHRGWRESHKPAHYTKEWYETIGYGIHTVALDLDNNNETEIGLGLTISFAEDLLQLGYGVDLSNDEKYFFIATRLFDF